MRLLIIPNNALPYDQRMVRSLALALRHAGHEAQALSSPVEDFALSAACQAHDVDVVLRVNRFRPLESPLPTKVRHIGWFQDVFPETLSHVNDRIQARDIVYVLGDPETLGFNVHLPCYVGTLLTGIDGHPPATKRSGSPQIDFSLCAYIPHPMRPPRNFKKDLAWYVAHRFFPWLDRIQAPQSTFIGRLQNVVPYSVCTSLISVVEATYQPLRGNLNIHQLTAAMHEMMESTFHYRPPTDDKSQKTRKPTQKRSAPVLDPYFHSGSPRAGNAIERFISYLAREYPRLLDRETLVSEILTVSTSLELYGPGWSEHAAFRRYHRGILNSPAELTEVYRRSRINLANNTHGLGLHSRTLECMAAGGFILTHDSPADDKLGGMRTAFEPAVHYGVFTSDTITEEASRWLCDEAKRKTAAEAASVVVRQNHSWQRRAEQILADLNR